MRKKSLSSLFFLVEKCNGKIKVRRVTRGDNQCMFEGYVKSNASLPTVLTDGVIITTAIDAHERCNVTTMDIPGAFLNTENDEFVLMLL